jgi:neutral ceramidase
MQILHNGFKPGGALAWVLFLALLQSSLFAQPATERSIGVGTIDITPSYSIRLTGYAVRKAESEGVAQRLWAKALAFGSDRENPAILITVDNCGVTADIRQEVVARLKKDRGIRADRVAICSSHTHTGPCLTSFAPNIFGEPLPPEHQARVTRYTHELTDALETVAIQALATRRPARLTQGRGEARFAANRRTKGGPVDHQLPALFVSNPDGTLRAVFASYACHCTTLGGEFNQICGDWVGYAQEEIEREHPGTTALIAVGCAADANPAPRTGLDLAKQHGKEISLGINAILSRQLHPVNGKLVCRTKQINLPFDKLPTRAEWELKAKDTGYPGSHARLNLARLDKGEKLPTKLPYMIQTWSFGDSLAMLFLPGEVVVDYSLRLKRDFDDQRFWINAYANDVPCYIPSRRIWQEGGYEGGGAMIFYDRPTRLSENTEEIIISTVHDLIPKKFLRK